MRVVADLEAVHVGLADGLVDHNALRVVHTHHHAGRLLDAHWGIPGCDGVCGRVGVCGWRVGGRGNGGAYACVRVVMVVQRALL